MMQSPTLSRPFSQDGKWIATMIATDRGQLFDATTGQAVGRPFTPSDWSGSPSAFYPDNRHLAVENGLLVLPEPAAEPVAELRAWVKRQLGLELASGIAVEATAAKQ
jgi:hypothetical protein